MDTHARTGRLAGLYWLLATVTGGYGLSYYRSSIIVAGDAAATAANIAAYEFDYRVAIVGILLSQVFMVFFGLTVFRLFREPHRSLATVFLVSVLMTATIAIVNTFNHFGALLVMSQVDYLRAFTVEQLQAMAMMFLRMSNAGQGLLEIFWTPLYCSLALLAWRSRALPRILAVLLFVMGVGFAVNILDKMLVPTLYPAAFTQMAMTLGALGGIPTILWLLIRGVREEHADSTDVAD